VRDIFRIIIWALTGLIVAVTLLAFGDRLALAWRAGWVFDLLAHWPRHLLFAALFAGGLAIWRRMRITAATAFGAAAINAFLFMGFSNFATPQPAPPGAREIRIVSANVHRSMDVLENLAAAARAYNADIVSLYEVPRYLTYDQLAALFPQLTDGTLPSVGVNDYKLMHRSAVMARNPDSIDETFFEGSNGVVIRARIAGIAFTATHPPSPGTPTDRFDRDRQLTHVGAGLDTTQPFITAGDFNSTPWSRIYSTVPGTRAGDPRFEGTFPLGGPLGLPIDHIRFGGGLILTDYRVGPSTGSDHLPLFATFALPPTLPEN